MSGLRKLWDVLRENADSLAVAVALALVIRARVGEIFHIPTGSMAPTLYGRHLEIECPRCQYLNFVGVPQYEDSPTMRHKSVCPLCELDLPSEEHPIRSGDKIIADKFGFFFSDPERYEVLIFKPPRRSRFGKKSDIPFIKRLVGLPGEEISIEAGEVLIDGKVQAKPWQVQEEVWRLVYDHRYDVPSVDYFEGEGAGELSRAGSSYQLDANRSPLVMRFHKAIKDHTAYNQRGSGGQGRHAVVDLKFSGLYSRQNQEARTAFVLEADSERVELVIPEQGAPRFVHRMYNQILKEEDLPGCAPGQVGRSYRWSLARWDGKVRIDWDDQHWVYDIGGAGRSCDYANVSVHQYQGLSQVHALSISRDLYYTSKWMSAYKIGSENYFMLGDNSKASSDSRDWAKNGDVEILGRPRLALLHLTLPTDLNFSDGVGGFFRSLWAGLKAFSWDEVRIKPVR